MMPATAPYMEWTRGIAKTTQHIFTTLVPLPIPFLLATFPITRDAHGKFTHTHTCINKDMLVAAD